jgi:hypothetical protein
MLLGNALGLAPLHLQSHQNGKAMEIDSIVINYFAINLTLDT